MVVGAVLVSAGLGTWSLAAGLVGAGLQCIAGGYVLGYLKARAR